MNRISHRIAMIAAAAALLIVGLAIGAWWARRDNTHDMATADTPAQDSQRKALYWYDPMVPDQHFPKSGKSPMGMEMVPKYADETAGGGVRIDPRMQQSVGIRTALVETGRLASALRVPGTLAWDLREESVISARSEGVVARVLVKAPYTRVRRGQPLATLIAPGWNSAIAEAQALRYAQSAAARELQAAAQQRLHVLGVPAGGMNGDGSVTLTAPSNGVLSEVMAREGQAVTPGMPLFRVDGTATMWLDAAIPQAGAAALRPGTPVEAEVGALPGQRFTGEIEVLLPEIDATSRTQRARIVLRNPDGVLAPGMYANVLLKPDAGAPVPLVPTEALISTGSDNRVIVQDADGGFRPVHVRVGRNGDGNTEILDGLKGGERVVVSGQFLLDSEASLSGALERIGDDTDAKDASP